MSFTDIKTVRVAWLESKHFVKTKNAFKTRDDNGSRLAGLKNAAVGNFRIKLDIFDLYPFPLNPFLSRHALFSSIDPLRALRVLFSLRRYDVVLAIGESSALLLILAKRLFRFRQPILVRDPALDFSWRPRRYILDKVMPGADGVLVFGKNQAELLTTRYAGKCKPIVVYHPIDTQFWKPLSVPSEGYILSVGNDHGRDFLTAIKAVRELDERLVIKTSAHALSQADEQPNVEVVRERITRSALRDLYAKAKLVIIPLLDLPHAGGVNSVLEAMSMGRASIVSASEGIMDYVIDNETCLVVPPGDVAAMRAAIIRLSNDDELADRLGRNARRQAINHFSSSRCSQKLAESIVAACT